MAEGLAEAGAKESTVGGSEGKAAEDAEAPADEGISPEADDASFRTMFLAVSTRLCNEAYMFCERVLESFPELRKGTGPDGSSPFARFRFRPPVFLTLSQFLGYIDKTLASPFTQTTVNAGPAQPSDAWAPQQEGYDGLEGSQQRLSSLARSGLQLDDGGGEAAVTLLDYPTFCEQVFGIVKKALVARRGAAAVKTLPHRSLVHTLSFSISSGQTKHNAAVIIHPCCAGLEGHYELY
jgi:hypothetical protein